MEILVSLAGKIAEYTVEPIQRQFGYLISYESNIQALREELKKLEDQISGVQLLVDDGARNLRDPMPAVQTWLKEARDTCEKINHFLDTEAARVGKGWCPDLRSRYSVSRKATKKTPDVVQLIQDGKFPADQISCPALPLALVSTLPMVTRGFQDFESRVIIMDKVMEALKDDTVNTICICGIGGVGKTTMANKIVNRVKKEKLFDEVAMAVVSQSPDLKKIRDAIADQLGLKLDQQSEEGRAAQLCARIVRINKLLLVLDDVWNELQLAEIGLPPESEYKILFTSRRKDVFLRSGGIIRNPTNYVVPTLSEEEAWCLFKESAGSCCEASDILPIAKQIVNECGGLPIAIVTVGSTLRGAESNKPEWSDALRELERGRHGNKAHSCIKWSYDYLKCEEHQGIFLLCCLFPEDADIPIETLFVYGMGLGLLTKDEYSFQEARNRVCTLVGKLSRSFLLLQSGQPEHVKMHDVVRDVGISLASEDQENGLMNTCKYYGKSDSVILEKRAGRFDASKLKLLWLSKVQQDIPFNFFEGMKKLNVLALNNIYIYIFGGPPKLPLPRFDGLENIQSLSLENFNFHYMDISAIGGLKKLEILSFYGSCRVWLPSKLGLLTRLRLLDCRCARSELIFSPILHISYGILSGLKQLEELYLDDEVVWEMEKEGQEATGATVSELNYLSNLTTLTITLPNVEQINPKDLHFEKLVRFQINLGCGDPRWKNIFTWANKNDPFRNRLAIGLKGDEKVDHQMANLLINTLPKATEILHVDGGKTVISDAEDNLFDVLQMSSKKGFTGPSPSFSQLQSLHIIDCNMLKYVLPLSVARDLLQLKNLEVRLCGNVEEVFYLESSSSSSEGTITIKLPQLTDLVLQSLPKLVAFCKSKAAFEFPQLTSLELLGLDNLKSVFTTTPSSSKVEVAGMGLGEAKYYSRSHLFPKLNNLHIKNCTMMEEIFSNEEIKYQATTSAAPTNSTMKNISRILPPELKYLKLENNINLESIFEGIGECNANEFSLQEITISGCPKLAPSSFYFSLLNLSNLQNAEIAFENQKVLLAPKTFFQMEGAMFMLIDGMENLMDKLILDGKSQPRYFSNIRFVELKNLSFLPAAAYWLHFLQSLPKLENLHLSSCGSVEVIFGLGQGLNTKKFPQLAELKRTSLEKLTCIWMKTVPGIICQKFQKLRELHVDQCHSLKNLLTPSMVKHLVNLTTLTVENCSMVKEIASVEEICATKCKVIEEIGVQEDEVKGISTETIEFPQVKYLTLKDLPNLTSFCATQGYTFNWPSLKKIDVTECPRLEAFALAIASTPMLKEVETESKEYTLMQDLDSIVQPISKEKVAGTGAIGESERSEPDGLKQLQNLHLRRVSIGTVLPENLEELRFVNCPSLHCVFYLSDTTRSVLFPKLNNLHIQNCTMMVEIFSMEEISDEAGTSTSAMINKSRVLLPKLKHLSLENNANLKSIFTGIDAFSLEVITISGCPKLGPSCFSLLNSSELQSANIALENQKVSMSRIFISIDGIENLMDMLILDKKSQHRSFSSINSVELQNFLNFPAAAWLHFLRSLPNLEQLQISNCGSMEVIFGLHQGLNPMELVQLTKLKLTSLEKLRCIWMKGIPGILSQRFQKLRELHVGQCQSLRNILTPFMAKHLVNLTTLTVENCDMVKEIVSVEEICVTKSKVMEETGVQEDEGEEISNETIEFPQVKKLTLRNLPNLTSFCAIQGYTFNWPSLTRVFVTGCPRLETFTLTVPKTPNLEEVETESYLYPVEEDLNATIQFIHKYENGTGEEGELHRKSKVTRSE